MAGGQRGDTQAADDLRRLAHTAHYQADGRLDNIAALEIVPCGQAGHYARKDRPEEIAAAISAWVDQRRLR